MSSCDATWRAEGFSIARSRDTRRVSNAAAQSRILFLFPDSSEIRHLREPPKLRSRVRSATGGVWTVAEVLKSGIDTYTVTCLAPSPGVRDLAADLVERARDSLSPLRHAVSVSRREQPSTDLRTREDSVARTMPVPTDQRMTAVPDWVVIPVLPNASDAPIDSAVVSEATRIVVVNTNPRGMVHEPTCRWLMGALNSGGLRQESYVRMPANLVPPGKKHCSRC